jgi:hypothetical protein
MRSKQAYLSEHPNTTCADMKRVLAEDMELLPDQLDIHDDYITALLEEACSFPTSPLLSFVFYVYVSYLSILFVRIFIF